MKICEEGTKASQTTYADLKLGEVFKWQESRPYGEGPCMCITDDAYVYLFGGYRFGSHGCVHYFVTRYPNACITLGDPE